MIELPVVAWRNWKSVRILTFQCLPRHRSSGVLLYAVGVIPPFVWVLHSVAIQLASDFLRTAQPESEAPCSSHQEGTQTPHSSCHLLPGVPPVIVSFLSATPRILLYSTGRLEAALISLQLCKRFQFRTRCISGSAPRSVRLCQPITPPRSGTTPLTLKWEAAILASLGYPSSSIDENLEVCRWSVVALVRALLVTIRSGLLPLLARYGLWLADFLEVPRSFQSVQQFS